jgi:hypothetical protein
MIGSYEYCSLCKIPVCAWAKHLKSPEHQESIKRMKVKLNGIRRSNDG